MKLTILQENFQQAVNYLQKAIPSRPSLPILSSVLVEVSEKFCTISATDLYFGVRVRIPATVSEPGTMVVPGKQLKEVIQSLPAGTLSLEHTENQLTIKSENSKASLPTQPTDEFPPFPQVEGEQYSLPKAVLDTIKTYILKSASLDPTRPVLTGTLLDIENTALTVASTDGFRLATSTLELPIEVATTRLIVPAKMLEEVQRIAESEKVSQVSFSVSDELKQVFFSFDDVEVFARLIEGEFPPYKEVIPQDFQTTIQVQTEELQEQLKRALIFSRDVSSIVQLEYTPEELKVTSASPAAGNFEGQVASASINGPEGTIAFNAKYLLDYLQILKSGDVTLGLNGSQKPAVFKTADVQNYIYVVMPFRVNQ